MSLLTGSTNDRSIKTEKRAKFKVHACVRVMCYPGTVLLLPNSLAMACRFGGLASHEPLLPASLMTQPTTTAPLTARITRPRRRRRRNPATIAARRVSVQPTTLSIADDCAASGFRDFRERQPAPDLAEQSSNAERW